MWVREKGGAVNILVVDDQPEYRLVLKTILMDYGWTVFSAEDGEDALKTMARMPMDIIITDIYMPVMDGFRFHQTVRGIPGCEKLPFIFVSAHDDEHTLNAVKDPRYETFLRKTSSIDAFLGWIKHFALPEAKRPNRLPGTIENSVLPIPQYSFSL